MKNALPVAIVVALAIVAGVILMSGKGGDSEFSGERAMEHVAAIVNLGPRPPGSDAIEESRKYIEEKLAEFGWQTTRLTTVEETPIGEIDFVNIRARFGPTVTNWSDAGGLALLCSHYDTKWYDDIVFVGANDGGSSTGALIEIARVLAMKPSIARQVELVFFDGEENIGGEYTATDGLYGSRYYAKQFRRAPPEKKPRFGLLLDMIGEKDVMISVPADSPWVVLRHVYEAAEELDVRHRFRKYEYPITDDHEPLNRAGIPTLDIIDIDYDPWWHTEGDTLDKLSPDSLEMVSRVTLRALEKLLKSDVGR